MKRKLSLIMAVVMTLTMVFGYVGKIKVNASNDLTFSVDYVESGSSTEGKTANITIINRNQTYDVKCTVSTMAEGFKLDEDSGEMKEILANLDERTITVDAASTYEYSLILPASVHSGGSARPTSYYNRVSLLFKNEEQIEPKPQTKESDLYPAVRPEVTPVENINMLTADEIELVKGKIKSSNPRATKITVTNQGAATLEYSDGSENHLSQNETVVQKETSDCPNVDALKKEIEDLKKQIEDLKNEKKSIEVKITDAETAKEEAETNLQDKTKELEEANKKIAELEEKLKNAQAGDPADKETIKNLQDKLNAEKAKVQDLENKIKELEEKIATLENDKKDLENKLATADERIKKLEKQVSDKDARIAELEAEIAEKDKTIADKDDTIADLNKKAEELQKEIDDLKNHVDDLDEIIAKLKAEKDGLTDEINKANEDLDNAKKDLEALKKELEDAKAKAEAEKKALQDELDAEKEKLANLNKEIAKNEEDKKALQDELDKEKAKADADQDKIKELEDKIADKDNEKKALDDAKSELENKVAEKTAELEAKDKEIADLNAKIAEKEEAIKALEEKIAKLEAEKKDLEDKIKALLDKDTKKDDYIKELQDELEKIKKALEEAKAKEGIPSDKVAEDMKALQDQIAKLQKELEDAKKALENKDKEEDKKPETEKEFKVSELKDGDSKVEVTLPETIEAGDKVTVTKNGKKVGEKTLTNTDIKAGKTVVELTERVKPGDTIVTIITGKDGKEKASSFDGVRELTDAEVKERLKKLIDEARGIRNPSEELNKALDKAIDVIYDRFATINEYKWAIEDLERELDRIRHARNNRFKLELNAEPKVGDTKFEGTTQIKWYVDAFVNGKRVAYTQADARGNFTIELKEALKAGDKFRLFAVDPRNDDDYTEVEWKLDKDEKSDDKNSKVEITDEMLKGQGLDPKELVIFPVGQLFYNIVKDGEKTTVNMDARPYNDNGRIMIPMRYVAYAMGFNVEWDNNTREAVFTNNSNPVLPKRTIRVQIDTGKVYDTEGNVYNFDRKPVNINGRIHVSISNVAKAFGATTGYITDGVDQTIEWDQAKQAVYVFKYVK